MRSQAHSPGGQRSSEPESELVAIARITKTRGRHGEVVARILTDYPDRFADVGQVYLQRMSGEMVELQVDQHWFHQDRLILHFAGYDSIDRAETLVGGVVKIGADELVELEEDEFFHFQLCECQVITTGGAKIGWVAEVMETPGGSILVVRDDQEKEYLIPFVKSICPDVDIESKRIRIDPPDGLLDL